MRGDGTETQVLLGIEMHVPLTRPRRIYAEERYWKDVRGFRCARQEN